VSEEHAVLLPFPIGKLFCEPRHCDFLCVNEKTCGDCRYSCAWGRNCPNRPDHRAIEDEPLVRLKDPPEGSTT
jgi:hypothetical protein